eukprot:g49990.t1
MHRKSVPKCDPILLLWSKLTILQLEQTTGERLGPYEQIGQAAHRIGILFIFQLVKYLVSTLPFLFEILHGRCMLRAGKKRRSDDTTEEEDEEVLVDDRRADEDKAQQNGEKAIKVVPWSYQHLWHKWWPVCDFILAIVCRLKK